MLNLEKGALLWGEWDLISYYYFLVLLFVFLKPISEPVSHPEGNNTVTLVPGDGVGPELMNSVQDVFSAAGVPVDFEEIFIRCDNFTF